MRPTMRYLLFFICLVSLSAKAQDTLITIADEQILAQVQEIKDYRVLYVPYASVETDIESIFKEDLNAIYFEDGLKQYFQPVIANVQKYDTTSIDGLSAEEIEQLGYQDAERFYRNKGAFWATFGATVGLPGAGIFTGIAVGGAIMLAPINPNISKLPQPDLYHTNESYRNGYQKSAEKRKLKEVLKGYAYAVGTQIALVVILILAL